MSKTEKNISPEQNLIAAKQEFIETARGFESFGIIKRNPKLSLSLAFLLGFGFMRLPINAKNLSIIPLIAETGNLLLKYTLSNEKNKRARGSDG